MERPLHPYTALLLECVPELDDDEPLAAIPGTVPHRYDLIEGCRFHERCPQGEDTCGTDRPELRELETGHWVRCHLAKP
jgi:oligopeptide/dipeptide ABC transporter ATP-binding protein